MNYKRDETIFILVVLGIIIAVAFYMYTHSFRYKVNRAINLCIDYENKTRRQCAQDQINGYIDVCQMLEPNKSRTQCENYYRDEYNKADYGQD